MADNKLQEYICPNCGGPLEFRGDVQKMVCVYCESEFDMSQFTANDVKHEEKTDWSQSQGQTLEAGAQGMAEWECNACGAVMVSDGQVGATECPYCGNPAIVQSTFEGMNLPDGIIPFTVTKQQAQDALKGYYSGKKLIPDSFISNNRVEKIQGVYVPFWLFDCEADGSVFYKAVKRGRSYTKKNGEETENWHEELDYAVSRRATMRYEKVPADGSKEMKDEYMDSIEPFDYSKIIAYNSAYFSGYLASKYDESAEEVKERVDKRIRNTTQEAIRDTVTGYDSVSTESANIHMNNGKINYCMLPVWMLTTQWNGGQYTFAMNGQTGKVTGDLPIDSGKSTKLFMLTLIISLVISELIAFFLLGGEGLWLGVAAVISLIIAFISVSSAKSSMVAHNKTEAKHYVVQGSFKLISQNDRHIGTRQVKG
ncbi:MAG: hypothetical protein IK115_02785 [Lachnospiraceae bacterium]|nr:hypothetical protein [Lachnospiraceae bacterium]